jgi:tetratricopeptide (TPR) repeat protein
VVLPDAVEDHAEVLRLAWKVLEHKPENADSILGVGAALYRAGLYRQALVKLQESIEAADEDPMPSAHLFRAMTLHRLGRAGDAREALQEGVRQVEAEDNSSVSWSSRVNRKALRQEAEQTLGVKKP